MVGNLSNFTKIDVLRCLLRIDKPVSRSQLSKTLDLGEGTIRAILSILKKNKLLESNKQGHYLSTKGNKIVKKIRNNINMKKIDLINISPNKKNVAVHIKKLNKIGKSYVLRDEAVKNGADGALILNYDKKLKLYNSDYKQRFSEIENKFDFGKK
jgi:predicted transcriptional regulator